MILRRVLVIGLEFVEPLFSGNGILTHSVVNSLLSQNYSVTVLCAQPSIPEVFPDPIEKNSNDKLQVISVPVPANKWNRLDKGSAWEELAYNAPRSVLHEDFGTFDYVLGIDWSALATYNALRHYSFLPPNSVYINMVFRVFSKSKELIKSPEDKHFYYQSEALAMEEAAYTFALSHVDKKELNTVLQAYQSKDSKINVLIPPLRDDFLKLATEEYADYARKYLLFNARFSPEKNVVHFAKMMKQLSDQGYLKKWNVTPLLIGSVCDAAYADLVRSLLPPEARVINDFLQPKELLFYLKQTVLQIHPPTYEAYGMVLAEAAAAGTPSMIHQDSIGVTSLLRADHDEILTTDMSSLRRSNSSLIKIMNNRSLLKTIGENAQQRAFEWKTEDYGKMLITQIAEKAVLI